MARRRAGRTDSGEPPLKRPRPCLHAVDWSAGLPLRRYMYMYMFVHRVPACLPGWLAHWLTRMPENRRPSGKLLGPRCSAAAGSPRKARLRVGRAGPVVAVHR